MGGKPRGKGPGRGKGPPLAAILLQQQRLALEAAPQQLETIKTFLMAIPPSDRSNYFRLSIDELRKEARKLNEEETREIKNHLGGNIPPDSVLNLFKKGGYPALVDRVMGLHASETGKWKIFSWPGHSEEFIDRSSFLSWFRKTKLDQDDLVSLLDEQGIGEDGKKLDPTGDESLRKIINQLAQDLQQVSQAIDSLDTPSIMLAGMKGSKSIGSTSAFQQYRTLCIEGVWKLTRSLLQAPEAFSRLFLGPLETYVRSLVHANTASDPDSVDNLSASESYRLSFQDLGKITLMDLYKLFGWMEGRVEALKERLEEQARSSSSSSPGQGASGPDRDGPVEVLEISPDGSVVGLSRSWLNLLQGTQEGPDGRMIESSTASSSTSQAQANPQGLGVLLDFLSGTVVHTAERIRESAHAPLGSYVSSVTEVSSLIQEGLFRAGQVQEQADNGAELERKLSSLLASSSTASNDTKASMGLSQMVERELLLASAKVQILEGELKELGSKLRALQLEVSYEEHLVQREEEQKGSKSKGASGDSSLPRTSARLQSVTEELELVEQTIRRREEIRRDLFAQQGVMLRKLSDVIMGKRVAPQAGDVAGPAGGSTGPGAEEKVGEVLKRVVGIDCTAEEDAAGTLRLLSQFVKKQRALLSLHRACLRQLELHLADLACVDYGSLLAQKVVLPLITSKLHQTAEKFHEEEAERRMNELLKEEGAAAKSKKATKAKAKQQQATPKPTAPSSAPTPSSKPEPEPEPEPAQEESEQQADAASAGEKAQEEAAQSTSETAPPPRPPSPSSSSESSSEDSSSGSEEVQAAASTSQAAAQSQVPAEGLEEDDGDFQVVQRQKRGKEEPSTAAPSAPQTIPTKPRGGPHYRHRGGKDKEKEKQKGEGKLATTPGKSQPSVIASTPPSSSTPSTLVGTAWAKSPFAPSASVSMPSESVPATELPVVESEPSTSSPTKTYQPLSMSPSSSFGPIPTTTATSTSAPAFELSSINISLLSQLSAIAVSLGSDLGQLLGSPLLSGAGLSGLLNVSPEQISNALEVLSNQMVDRYHQLQTHCSQLQHSVATVQSQLHLLHQDIAYVQSILAIQRTQQLTSGGSSSNLCILCRSAPKCGGFVHSNGVAHVKFCAGCVSMVETGGSKRCPACGDDYLAAFAKSA